MSAHPDKCPKCKLTEDSGVNYTTTADVSIDPVGDWKNLYIVKCHRCGTFAPNGVASDPYKAVKLWNKFARNYTNNK